MTTKVVAFLIFDQVQALDVVGPMDAFAEAGQVQPNLDYKIILISPNGEPVVASNGMLLTPTHKLNTKLNIDTLVIPGGAGTRSINKDIEVLNWIRNQANKIKRLATICTGTYLTAATGLLDHRKVTTHWRFAEDVAKKFPNLKVVPQDIYIKDDMFYTSGGLTAGIDLALFMIEEDVGGQVAQEVARELVVYLKRPGNQAQFSETLKIQNKSAGRFEKLTDWLVSHLDYPISLDQMANQVAMSPRHFRRQFKLQFDLSPMQYLENLRIDRAKLLLESSDSNIEVIARTIGFNNTDVFRRSFKKHLNLTPTDYRQRFTKES